MEDARLYSATLTFTTMGGLLGLAMGLGGGIGPALDRCAVRAAILGLVLGAAAAASVSLVLVSIFFKRHDPQSGDLVLPLLTHGAIWSAVGAIGGLAFGLGLGGQGRWKATLVGGLAGAAAATVVYEIVGALAFASSKTDLPLSSSITTRGMAQLLVAILSAVGAVLALHQSAKQTGLIVRALLRTDAARPRSDSASGGPCRQDDRRPTKTAAPGSPGAADVFVAIERAWTGSLSIAVGTDHLATIACAERLVRQHVDRILDEPDAAVGESEIAPAGMVAAGIDETRTLRRATEAGNRVKRQLRHGYSFELGGTIVLNSV